MRTPLYAGCVAAALALGVNQTNAQTYTPLLDEYEGVKSNNGNYLILPAFENTDPRVRKRAYFIFPKFLGYALDETDGSLTLGVNHVGFSLLPDGSPDFPPRAAFVATVVSIQDNKVIAAIKDELTKRDVAAGFQEPAFPVPAFENYEISLIAAGLASQDEDQVEKFDGGYPGQPFVVKKTLYSDADRAFVLETPSSAGRDAKLWGVAVRGKIKGYGNRLNCTISMNHKKVYDYFAARASGQAYWGLVKADVSKEVRSMSDNQVVDFGPCRGDQDKIDKLVMPVWQLILEMQNDEGERMFYQMIKEVTTGTNHPEASQSGWGFQASARWATVSTEKSVTFNFNVSTPIYWTLPMGINFASSCSRYKSYFVNASDPKKPCVDAKDAFKIRTAQANCVIDFTNKIAKMPITDEEKLALRKQLKKDGCGFNFTSPGFVRSYPQVEQLNQNAARYRQSLIGPISQQISDIEGRN